MNIVLRACVALVLIGTLAGCSDSPEDKLGNIFKDHLIKAQQGDANAQLQVGLRYDWGEGVGKDVNQAATWYQKSAVQGLANAQFLLGDCYAKGEGVAKNDTQSVSWYRKAAEQGHGMSQYNLGFSYEQGIGVTKDMAQAILWYQKSARTDFAPALKKMGDIYASGAGVPKNTVEAYAYWNLAQSQHYAAKKNISDLEKNLSSDDLAAGQKRSSELRKEIIRPQRPYPIRPYVR
jgi:TPR repeat protein